jgi:acetylornithine deacetylase/succinyl-diaminopimelate desuccinylase-like protein
MIAETIDEKRLVKTLQELVRIPSIESCDEISAWVKKDLEADGFQVCSDKDGNLIVEIGKGPGFLLNSHMDTVPAENWDSDPFSGVVKNNKLYGRGASDDKSGVAAMMEILKLLKEPNKRLVFAFTVAEEATNSQKDGAYSILPKLENIERGIVLEPRFREDNSINIGLGGRGRYECQVDVLGRAGHSGYPELADNAIYRAYNLINAIRKMNYPEMRINNVGVIKSCCTVTQISAIEGRNVIPGVCTLTLDYRSVPAENKEDIPQKIRNLCEKTLESSFRIKNPENLGGFYINDKEFLDLSIEAIKETGCKPNPMFPTGGNDGEIFFSQKGIKTFSIGPGNIDQMHKVDEYCSIDGLIKTTNAILNIIKKWDGQNADK